MRLVTEARNSQQLWTISGLDGTSFQLPVDEMAKVASMAKRSQKLKDFHLPEGFPDIDST